MRNANMKPKTVAELVTLAAETTLDMAQYCVWATNVIVNGILASLNSPDTSPDERVELEGLLVIAHKALQINKDFEGGAIQRLAKITEAQ